MRRLSIVVAPQNRGWVLENIATELAARIDGASVDFAGDDLPPADAYFFTHPSLFLDGPPPPTTARTAVFFTHPWWSSRVAAVRHAWRLRRADHVVSMSSLHARALVRAGLPRSNVAVAIPGVDLERFRPHERGAGTVGACSAYYERKAPGRLVDVVRATPSYRWTLFGRGWRGTPELAQLEALDHFAYVESSYDALPGFYAGLDVFVSLSRLEGGPIPLLEAMASNCVPVATATGFAPDLVVPGHNGYLCDVDASVAVIVQAIERAAVATFDVSSTVADHTWARFAEVVGEIVLPQTP